MLQPGDRVFVDLVEPKEVLTVVEQIGEDVTVILPNGKTESVLCSFLVKWDEYEALLNLKHPRGIWVV